MRKINWWIDPLMLPIVAVSFLVGYIYYAMIAGFAAAEFVFDPDTFRKLYGTKNKH